MSVAIAAIIFTVGAAALTWRQVMHTEVTR
jgi:hypothetical protein